MNTSGNTTTLLGADYPAGNQSEIVSIPADRSEIVAELMIPKGARGLVISSAIELRGDGSGKEVIVRHFGDHELGSLFFHMPSDSSGEQCDFELFMLTHRLLQVTRWAKRDPRTRQLGMGYLGANLNAAAALVAASQMGYAIQAIVAYDGSPDAAGSALGQVTAPTLLIVGEGNESSLQSNRRACDRLVCRRKLVVVPQAEHDFILPATLATLATDWFIDCLKPIPGG